MNLDIAKTINVLQVKLMTTDILNIGDVHLHQVLLMHVNAFMMLMFTNAMLGTVVTIIIQYKILQVSQI